MAKNKIVILTIKDEELVAQYLVKNPTQKALKDLQTFVDKRHQNEDWEIEGFDIIDDFVFNNFEVLEFNEEVIDF